MSLLCSLTGQVATHPVLNPANGRVYEKHMIEQHLLTSSTDPITNEPLSVSSLIAISPASLALPPFLSSPSAASLSLSTLLSTLQREYDGLMLEQFQLRRDNHALKQELAHALYQYDAACRVIARLLRERDEAKAALLTVSAGGTAAGGKAVEAEEKQRGDTQAMEVEGERKAADSDGGQDAESKGVPVEVTAAFEETSERLGGKKRKAWVKQKVSSATSKEDVAKYTVTASFTLHGASVAGVTAVDVDEREEGSRLLLTGGMDGSVIVFDGKAGKIRESIKGHKKRVTAVAFVQPSGAAQSSSPLPLLSSSSDHSVHLYTYDPEQQHYAQARLYTAHTAAVTAVSVHPSGLYFASASADCSYRLHSLTSAAAIAAAVTPSPLSFVSFHPDGRILATAHSDRAVRIYDVLQSQCVASFAAHKTPATTVAFSPNGYQCATGDDGGVVRIWDLRKVGGDKADVAVVEAKGKAAEGGGGVGCQCLCYDDSGGLLVGGAGASVLVWDCKDWSELVRLDAHSAEVRGVKAGKDARWLVSASKDRTVKLWGKPSSTIDT